MLNENAPIIYADTHAACRAAHQEAHEAGWGDPSAQEAATDFNLTVDLQGDAVLNENAHELRNVRIRGWLATWRRR